MKSIKIFVFLCIAFASACNKKDVLSSQRKSVDRQAVMQVEQLPEVAQKSGYRLLNDAEKAEIWKRRIEEYQSKEDLKPEQKDFLTEMSTFLTAEVFGQSNTPHYIGLVERFGVRSKNILGAQGAYIVAGTLAPMGSFDVKGGGEEFLQLVEPNPSKPDCECTDFDDWCSWGKICRKQEDKCTASLNGCGMWWTKPCNGMCDAKDAE